MVWCILDGRDNGLIDFMNGAVPVVAASPSAHRFRNNRRSLNVQICISGHQFLVLTNHGQELQVDNHVV
jgi:hypothetical protein